MSQTPAPEPVPSTHRDRPVSAPFRLAGHFTRGIMIIAVLATLVTAAALLVYGALETWTFLNDIWPNSAHPLSHDQVLLHAIELVDLFLLATVVEVVSLGLFQLYFRPDLDLPKWLRIDSLDDLKSKLVGVTVTVLAVFFLGQAIVWSGGPDILYIGGAIALMIAALTFFLRSMDH